MSLSIYKCHDDAVVPKYATKFSSCFDIHACLIPGWELKGKLEDGADCVISVTDSRVVGIPPKSRILVPTGLKFNIPPCCSVRLHPRSGMAFKYGLMLVNCEGVIDEDYCEQVFAAVYNCSNNFISIAHSDRICQAEMIKDSRTEILETKIEPLKKSDRLGGFGSTGTK